MDSAPTAADMVAAIIALIVLPALYLLPALIGLARRVQRLPELVMFNLIAGATVLGWIWALLWACSAPPRPEERDAPVSPRAPSPSVRWPLRQDWRLRRIVGLPYLHTDPAERWRASGD